MPMTYGDNRMIALSFWVSESSWNPSLFEEACRVLEQRASAGPIEWEVTTKKNPEGLDETNFRFIKNRKRYFERALRTGGFRMQNDDSDTPLVFLAASTFYQPERSQAWCRNAHIMVFLLKPEVELEDYIVLVGDSLRANRCFYMEEFSRDILNTVLSGHFQSYTGRDAAPVDELSAALPVIREWEPKEPLRPTRLGWLNYWSPDVCALLGFPDPAKDAELLARSYQTSAGAWLVKLTDDPFDITRSEHREAIIHAYQRFDQVGVRNRISKLKPHPAGRPSLPVNKLLGPLLPDDFAAIANAALCFWDMYAEDVPGEKALEQRVAKDLGYLGLEQNLAAKTAAMATLAMNSLLMPGQNDSRCAGKFTDEPIYLAMLDVLGS